MRILNLDDLKFMDATLRMLDVIFDYGGPSSEKFHVEGYGTVSIRDMSPDEDGVCGNIEVDFIEDGRTDVIMRCHYSHRVAKRIKRHLDRNSLIAD